VVGKSVTKVHSIFDFPKNCNALRKTNKIAEKFVFAAKASICMA